MPAAAERFLAARQAMLRAFHAMIEAGHTQTEMLQEAESTASAMRQLVALLHG